MNLNSNINKIRRKRKLKELIFLVSSLTTCIIVLYNIALINVPLLTIGSFMILSSFTLGVNFMFQSVMIAYSKREELRETEDQITKSIKLARLDNNYSEINHLLKMSPFPTIYIINRMGYSCLDWEKITSYPNLEKAKKFINKSNYELKDIYTTEFTSTVISEVLSEN